VAGVNPEHVVLIGIDCAVKAHNVGLARGELAGKRARLTDVRCGSPGEVIAEQILAWLENQPHALIALDAPLGWPAALGRALARHRAGDAFMRSASQLFRRTTDDLVHEQLDKRPRDVGAARIARTAHAALHLLYEVRALSGLPIPLAWTPGKVEGVRVIEVYPAGTLVSRRRRSSPSAGQTAMDQRGELLGQLLRELGPPAEAKKQMLMSDHAFDAAVSVLAAVDFLTAEVFEPSDPDTARQEGWIWVRKPVRHAVRRTRDRPHGSVALAPP
jgi:predicted nuclease with RNAse H fold